MKKNLLFLAPAMLGMLTSCTVNDNGEFELTWLFWVVIIVAVIIFIAAGISNRKEEEKLDTIKQELNQAAAKYRVSAEVTGIKNRFKMIFVEQEQKIVVLYPGSKVKTIKYDDIRGVELVEDGTILQSKSMMRTVGGALVGNMVAGGAGAIIGGLSGDSKQKKKISSIDVVLKLRGLSEPTYKVNCFDAQELCGSKEIKTDDSIFGNMLKEGLADANKIVEMVGVVIDANDRKEAAKASPAAHDPSISDVEALEKLVSMREKGMLTDQEFESMKAKLLSK